MYIDTNKLAHTEENQWLRNISVEMFASLTERERKQVLVQLQDVHQTMHTIVYAVMETMRRYSAS